MPLTQAYTTTNNKETGIHTKNMSDCNAHAPFMQYHIASISIIIKVNQVNFIFSLSEDP